MRDREKTEYFAVHCSATPPDRDIGRAAIDRMHRRRGWSMIGYHLIIRRNGRVEPGRPLYAQGAHVRGFNDVAIGVCLIGGVNTAGDPEDNFTAQQFDSLRGVLDFLWLIWPEAEARGHRDFSPDLDGDGKIEAHEWLKMCPCFDVAEFLGTALSAA